MLVTPAATAQLMTVRFTRMIVLATVIGCVTSVAGLYLSFWLDVASGATIVLVQTATFVAALVLARGTAVLRRRQAVAATS
jgi:ABC-type Mn2+/Zn2+ transport system permease subunit